MLSEILRRRLFGGRAAVHGVRGQPQRWCRRGNARAGELPVFWLKAEKCRRAVIYEGRTLLLSVGVRQRADHRKAVRRERQAVIDKRELAPQLALSRAAEIHAALEQPRPLSIGEHSGLISGARQSGIARAEDYQVLYAAAAHPVKISG